MTRSAHVERPLARLLVIAAATCLSARCGPGADVLHHTDVLTRELQEHGSSGRLSADAYEALAALRRRDPRELPPVAVVAVASAHVAQRQFDEATAVLARALEAAPDSAPLAASLAAAVWMRSRPGDRVEAFDRTLRALDANSNDPDLVFNAAEMARMLLPAEAWRRSRLRHLSAERSAGPGGRGLRVPALPGPVADPTRSSSDGPRAELLDRLLPAWAAACRDRDPSESGLRARIEAVSAQPAFREDRFFGDIVTRLPVSRRGPGCDRRVAEQLVRFAEARDRYRRDELPAAGLLFRAAASATPAVWPLSLSARLFAAIADYFSGAPGQRASARREFDAVAADARRAGYFELVGRAEWMRAYAYDDGLAYEAAIAAYDAARLAYERANSVEGIALADSLRASALDWLGEYREAWRLREPAMARLALVDDPRARSTMLTGMIRAASREGWRRAALELARAKLLDPALEQSATRYAQALVEVAEMQGSARGRALDGASQEAEAAIGRVAAPASRDRLRARLLAVRARIEPDPHKAVALLGEALDLYRGAGAEIVVARLLLARARAHIRTGHEAGADADLREGAAVVERALSEIGEVTLRLSYFDEVWDLFDELVELRLRRGDAAEALAILDRVRGRELRQAAQRRVGTRSAAGPSSAVPTAYYAVLRTRIVMWIIGPARTVTIEIPVPRERLSAEVRAFAACVAAARSGAACEAPLLWQWLIAPVLEHAPGETLAIVPDPLLQPLPFAALRDPSSRRYLVERVELRFAPSLDRVVTAAVAAGPRRAFVVGEPVTVEASAALPHAAAEARAVSSIYEESTLLVGHDASRSRFLAELPSAEIVHFAGHALADPEVPSLSRLLMSADPDGRGNVYAHEIRLRRMLPSSIVILAACETAAGRTYRSEGTASLARAFLAAGARDVVATLWPIDDLAARPMFVALHRGLSEGKRAADALRSAQLALLRSADPALRAPAAWASAVAWTATAQ